jgi:hypothetical protein
MGKVGTRTEPDLSVLATNCVRAGRGAARPRPVGSVSEDFEVGVDGHRVGQDVANR